MVLTYKHETYRRVIVEETKGVKDLKGTITHVCHEWQQWRGSTIVIMKVYHDLRRSCDVVGDWGQWSTTMLSFCRKPQNIQYTWEGKKEKNLKECVCVCDQDTHTLNPYVIFMWWHRVPIKTHKKLKHESKVELL